MNQIPWQFWIDVGGTFTDCLARRPDGTLVRHKRLSSAVTKGAVASVDSASGFHDPLRIGDPANFWRGYALQLIDQQGQIIGASVVTHFDTVTGRFELAEPLKTLKPGAGYELSNDERAPIIAIRYLLGLRLEQPIPRVSVRLGTTRGTNALLTRSGAKTALVTTTGFGDVLHIGYQNRPRLFDLNIKKPTPLFSSVIEIDERMAADGSVLRSLDETSARERFQSIKTQGVQSLAICLMHATINPTHERRLEEIAREIGFAEISVSHQVAALVKIVPRGDTTVVDAYLNPLLRDYVAELRRSLGDSELRLMTSAGGLIGADAFSGKDSILSGPAGGVVGFVRSAAVAGFERAIGFDMGGTSTDVARFDGEFELEYETEKAGVRVVAPMLAVHTVAAGGGSVCGFDGVKLIVGPDSAGADPGPACYGRGGPLAVTDVNVYLGRILAKHFPFPLDRDAIEQRLRVLCDQIEQATGRRYAPIELCDGYMRVANSNMVKAIQTISIAKGADPRDYVLVGFGGAAAQHVCGVARELRMQQILIPPDASILSAYGIGVSDVSRRKAIGVYQPYSAEQLIALEQRFVELTAEARSEVIAEGIAAEQIKTRRFMDLRYQGLDAYLTLSEPTHGTYAEAYAAEHQRLYGYHDANRPLEVVALRVEAIGQAAQTAGQTTPPNQQAASAQGRHVFYADGQPVTAAVFHRDALAVGQCIAGPALIQEAMSTTVVEPEWTAELLASGGLLLRWNKAANFGQPSLVNASAASSEPADSVQEADPILLEIFNQQFSGVAEQMGVTLRQTSSSVNVKQRLDFSCAVFTATGDLVVNAPHIPVHLGAMGETVRRIIADNRTIVAGDVFVTNDPYRGGSHLPDVTVVTPVHDAVSGELIFFTASRAHHAEIGGIQPGSMPPFSKNLAEEGVLIRNFKLIDAGVARFDALRELLSAGPFPSRSIDDNLADIAAQVAANRQGSRDLAERLIARHGLPIVLDYMRHIQAAAERKMRSALAALPDGTRAFTDHLDDGSPICVTITIAHDSATIDFTGTGPVLPGNLNANRAIVSAAVMYCMRSLIQEDIPLNQGVLAPITLVLPECLLNPPEGESPETSAAMVGGNVETSQRVVDVLLGALGVAAASQGTMNNLLFGDATFGYYETICGGAGATATAAGADAVHTHMTNTRLTDPEVLEMRYPVRLQEFSIRRGSGGAGQHRGGDGVTRRIEFLKTLDVSILSQRRGLYAPYGVAGGQSGSLGVNTLFYVDGKVEHLGSQAQLQVEQGDTLLIETPGGGGWGASADAGA